MITSRRWFGSSPWVVVLAAGALVVVAVNLFDPFGPSRRSREYRDECAVHLHEIGVDLAAYAAQYGGRYPPDLAALIADGREDPEVLICRATGDTPAAVADPRPTTRAMAAATGLHGHQSYVFRGGGWTAAVVPSDAVVAYEPFSNHGNAGSNILFGDGHAEWFPQPRAARLIAAAAASTRPVSAASVP